MKQILLSSIIFLLFIQVSSAQRKIDLALDTITEPLKIYHNQIIKASFVIKNLGPDLIKTGDTIFYQAFLRKNQRVTPTIFSVFTQNLSLNDTMSFTFNVSAEQVKSPSFRSDFCILVTLRNRKSSDSIFTESTSGSANNLKCLSLEYIDSNGWGVGVRENEFLNSLVKLYPNPVCNEAVIEFYSHEAGTVLVMIFDNLGRQMRHQNIEIQNAGIQRTALDLSDLEPGIYSYHLVLGHHQYIHGFAVAR